MSDEQFESDANEQVEVSSEPSESSEQESEQSASTTEETAQAEPQPAKVPFHEDPAIQDFIARQTQRQVEELRNQYDSQFYQLKQQYEQLQRANQPARAEDPLISRLKTIDPEFGNRIEKLSALESEIDQFRSWQQQQQQQALYQEANNTLEKLHTEHAIPAELRATYDARIQQLAMQNPNYTIKDLPKLYKQVHDDTVKFIDSVRRHERESYVADKKKVATKPSSQPKGEPVKPGKGPDWAKDPVERRDQAVQRILKMARSEGEI